MSDLVLAEIEELKLQAVESEKNTNCLVDLFPYLYVSLSDMIYNDCNMISTRLNLVQSEA